MISCCSSINKTKKCLKGIKGFTLRSSCAPYKYCKGGKNISKRVKLSQNYFKFLGERTKNNKEDRKKMVFNTQI